MSNHRRVRFDSEAIRGAMAIRGWSIPTLAYHCGMDPQNLRLALRGELILADVKGRIESALRGDAGVARARTGEAFICQGCHRPFRSYPSWAKRRAGGAALYCCRECYHASQPLKADGRCIDCRRSGMRRRLGRCRECHQRYIDSTARDRFEAFVRKSDSCWIWTGGRYPTGYGRWGRDYAHRCAYAIYVGPIPAGMTIDHTCFVKPCVNPLHLELVTKRENIQRYYRAKREGRWPGANKEVA